MRRTIKLMALMLALMLSLSVFSQRLTLPSMTWSEWQQGPHAPGSIGYISDLERVVYFDGLNSIAVIGFEDLQSVILIGCTELPVGFDFTLWELYNPSTPWLTGDMNYMLENEALLPVSQIAESLEKPPLEVIGQYFTTKGELEGKVTLDVMIYSGDDMTWSQWTSYYPERSEFIHQDVTVINANVGDFVKVNINAIYQYPPETQIWGFFSGNAINGINISTYPQDYSRFAQINAQIVRTGQCRIGTQLVGLKQGVLFVVDE